MPGQSRQSKINDENEKIDQGKTPDQQEAADAIARAEAAEADRMREMQPLTGDPADPEGKREGHAANQGDPNEDDTANHRMVAGGASPAAAAVMAVNRAPVGGTQQSQEGTVGLGLVGADGNALSVDAIVHDSQATIVKIKEPVYEKYVLAGSDPQRPRIGKRLAFGAGQEVPVREFEAFKDRMRVLEEGGGRKSTRGGRK